VDFGTGPLIAAGGRDAFALKIGPSGGSTLWAKQYGGTSNNEIAASVDIGANGYPVITGSYVGTANFGFGNVTAQGTDVFILQVDGTTGAPRWAKTGGGTGLDRGLGVWDDKATNNLSVVGVITGSADLGGGALSAAGGASTDVFIAKYLATGAFVWANAYGGTGADSPGAVSGFNKIVAMAGRFVGSVSFGGAPLVSAGNSDVFVARFVF
jgi:hypothetical protein